MFYLMTFPTHFIYGVGCVPNLNAKNNRLGRLELFFFSFLFF